MKVELEAFTTSSRAIAAADLVPYFARVSNPSNQMNHETAPKLLRYLMKNRHYSPFEMVSVTMKITTTRDIARQILRHRSFSFQEFSQRYANPVEELGFVLRDARMQDPKNRQNSIITDNIELIREWDVRQQEIIDLVTENYKWAIEKGIAKEQARAILPEGLTVSTLYMAGTLRSWTHYCWLRMKNGTQSEHADIALECWKIITDLYPALQDMTFE